jgi:hypothetical protein
MKTLLTAAIPLRAESATAVIRAEPLSNGRIEPALFGNFHGVAR